MKFKKSMQNMETLRERVRVIIEERGSKRTGMEWNVEGSKGKLR